MQEAPAMEAPQQNYNISVDEFLSDTLAQAKVSADTVINEETGIPEVGSTATAAALPEFSRAEADAQTKRMMQSRDMIQARLLAFIAKDPDRWKEFKLEQWEFDWLCEVYADTFQKIGKIPVWLDIVLAETMIMGPRLANVTKYRKIEMENEKLKTRIRKMETQKAQIRKDTKTLWQVDENGYFVHDTKGKYIKQDDRRVKAGISEAEYSMLIKHNDKETIDQIFDIG